ncbi:MAG: N-6 DNA methylase [Methylobacterium mesophilicum]|nr:N-6 DNA methylase [Methylobacterium mesophilicum]
MVRAAAGLAAELRRFGADDAALRLFEADGPELLPYATLLTAREAGNEDLAALDGVYEWQDEPLMFLISADRLQGDQQRLHRIRRIVAMRGDAPYLGVVGPGRLDVYRVGLDTSSPEQARIDPGVPGGQEIATFAHIANARPGLVRTQRNWISSVVLKLLSTSIDSLKTTCDVGDDDAISLVGRALFTRFLGDRELLSALNADPAAAAQLFDDAERAIATSEWLDVTFNGDFLPLSQGVYQSLPDQAYKILGNILRRAPDGQLFLGWAERWDNLDFAHIPVGVLSQAYEHYLRQHAPDRQRKEGGYYTPRPIADLMVRGAFQALGSQGQAASAHVLDPAAGAGVFLLTAFRQLVAERWRQDRVRPETHVLRDLLYQQITGFDINEAALRFAALGLYLISIELDPHPEPVRKLRFDNLRDKVLLKVGDAGPQPSLGSLGPAVGSDHIGCYDLVIGNPPWASGTKLPNWKLVQGIVADIAKPRLPEGTASPPIPNEVLDLPFVWRAMEWAKPDGIIAFALHARVLFQQGDGMQDARRALFNALDVTGIVNGVELRQTRVWPEVAAPFCLLYARNRLPPVGAGFRFVSPRLETSLNSAGGMRIDASNAEAITADEVGDRPEILKLLFKGTRADIQVLDRLRSQAPESLGEYWRRLFGSEAGRARYTGNGYQRLKPSSRVRKNGDGLPGVPATYLHGQHVIAPETIHGMLIATDTLPLFTDTRIHDPRDVSLFDGPLVVAQKAPPASLGRIRTAVIPNGAVFNASFYGYSGHHHEHGDLLVRYLSLLIGSKIALWQVLITSGEFGFERDTIEKATIDNLRIVPLEALSTDQQEEVGCLFQDVQLDRHGAWEKVDEWFAHLFRLRARDLQVVRDTLEYSLPFSLNRHKAQARPTRQVVEQFCQIVSGELKPWAERFGRAVQAVPGESIEASPWRSLRICSDPRNTARCDDRGLDWAKFLPLADHFAASEIALAEDDGCLWLGRLDQSRYWSETQARQLAQRVIWEHVDLLRGCEPT